MNPWRAGCPANGHVRFGGRTGETERSRGRHRAPARPYFYLLEAAGFETWLVNAKDVKHLPGRPKTDRLDAVWLCKVAERQMIRPSFVPPPQIRRLRDVTRYRIDLVAARTAEKQRAEKLLEDACIKLSVVASDIFGVSGRAMMDALVAGERNPTALAQLARSRMRAKISALEEAFTGHFTDHHAFLLAKMLGRVDAIGADIAELDAKIEEMVAPFASAVQRLDEIPGIGAVGAAIIISWSSSGTCSQTPRPATPTSAPASTTPGSATAARPATTSASSKPSVTKSPWKPPPDLPGRRNPAPLRSAGCCRAPS
jgi:Transposase